MRSCLRRIGGLFTALCALALVAAPTAGAALSGGYAADPAGGVAMPNPSPSDHFGTTVANVNGLVLVGVPNANNGEGAVVFVNPTTGETQRILAPLEPSRTEGDPTNFGASVAAIPDIGKCPSPTTRPGETCTPSASRDGVDDFLVGAPGANVNNVSGVDLGRVYVFDGSTRGVMKRIQIGIPSANAADPVPGAPMEGKPDFGRSVSSLSGAPPCLRSGGLHPCSPADRVTVGDADGDTVADIVVGAPLYRETEDSSLACHAQPGQSCSPTGRIYLIKGADLTAPGDKLAASDESHLVFGGPLTYPYSEPDVSTSPSFGTSVVPLGDIGSCDTTGVLDLICPNANVRSAPDGVPDFLVSGPGVDAGPMEDAGAAFVIDGASMTILSKVDSPSPQQGGRFGASGSTAAAAGDLGASQLPDVYLGAGGENGAVPLGQGRGYVFSGDATLPPAARLFATADDPTPQTGAGFGAAVAPVGDIAGDAPGELLIGEVGGAGDDVHIFSSCANVILQTIPTPVGAVGFGTAVVPVGDVNGDGYADFAVGAPAADNGAGRVFIMKSDGSTGPAFAGCTPDPGPGGGGGGGSSGGTGGSTGGGGSTATTPPKQGKAVSVLAKRKLSFAANKKKVKVAAVVRFRGTLLASKRKRSCQGKQKIAIQRYQPNGGAWTTIDVAITGRKGTFTSDTRPAPAQTFLYRAHVNQTKRCATANSKRLKITATD
jgi:hypothetical protein